MSKDQKQSGTNLESSSSQHKTTDLVEGRNGEAPLSQGTLSVAVIEDTVESVPRTNLPDPSQLQERSEPPLNQGQSAVALNRGQFMPPAPHTSGAHRDQMFQAPDSVPVQSFGAAQSSAFQQYVPPPFPTHPFQQPSGYYPGQFTQVPHYTSYSTEVPMYYARDQAYRQYRPMKRRLPQPSDWYGSAGSTHDNAICLDDSDDSPWNCVPRVKKEKIDPYYSAQGSTQQASTANIPNDMMTPEDMRSFFSQKAPLPRKDGKPDSKSSDNNSTSRDVKLAKAGLQQRKKTFDQKTSELKEFLKVRTTVTIDTEAFEDRLRKMNRYMVNIAERDHTAFYMAVAMHIPHYQKIPLKEGGATLKRDLIQFISVNRYEFSEVSFSAVLDGHHVSRIL